MRLLVCGGRDYADVERVTAILDAVHRKHPLTALIEGGAKGADTLAARWAHSRGIPVETFRANWDTYGRSAGFLRNAEMLREGKPSAVVAFPGSRGTADMVKQATLKGVPVWEIK